MNGGLVKGLTREILFGTFRLKYKLRSKEIYFTSGGTEADNWAIKNVLFSSDTSRKKIITS